MPSEQEVAAVAKALEAELQHVLPAKSYGFALLARTALEAAEKVRVREEKL